MITDDETQSHFTKSDLLGLPLVSEVFDEIGFDAQQHFHVVRNHEELKTKAFDLGLSREDAESKGAGVHGLRVAPDPGEDLPILQIIIRHPFSEDFYERTLERFEEWDKLGALNYLNPKTIAQLLHNGSDERLAMYIILHEVGHHVHRHVSVPSGLTDVEKNTFVQKQEVEADNWAVRRIQQAKLP